MSSNIKKDTQNIVRYLSDFDEDIEKAKSQLDKYDFAEELLYCFDNGLNELSSIIYRIIDVYPELQSPNSPLDYLDDGEFMDYLMEVYNVRFEDVITYNMWLNEDFKKR